MWRADATNLTQKALTCFIIVFCVLSFNIFENQSTFKMRDDEQFNITFVKSVEKYKCLYDYTRSDYKNVLIQDRAWQEIGNIYNETRK